METKHAHSVSEKLSVEYVPIGSLRHPDKNPRKWTKEVMAQVEESIARYGVVDPLVVNGALGREGTIIGGNLRYEILKKIGHETVPVVHVRIDDPAREAELIIRLNKNVAEFDLAALAEYDEKLLAEIGFSSEDLDRIFEEDDVPETFDLDKELAKLEIANIDIKHGDRFRVGDAIVMNGDSTVEADMLALMDGAKADMCLTDPPYRLSYMRHGKSTTTGFGAKRNRRYLETENLPEDFTDLWMSNVAKVQKEDFSIICYENWKNIREIWNAMEKFWKVKNMIVWHLPNRNQGYAGKHQFFSKHDIAMVGTSEKHSGLNLGSEDDELLENEYQTALFAINNNPHWESYGKGKKFCPTDFIEYKSADEKSSGQAIIFGTKPTEILIPYLKVLTERGGVILEPFGGSGSTAAAALKMKRRCYLMEKSPVYTAVILKRLEKLTGQKAIKI